MARNPALSTKLAEPHGSASFVSSVSIRRRTSFLGHLLAWTSRLALLAAVLLVLATSGLDAGQRFLSYRTYTVLSGSMRPGMPVGSLVLASAVPTASLVPGDVLTFHPPNRGDVLVTHRVVQVISHPTDVIAGDNPGPGHERGRQRNSRRLACAGEGCGHEANRLRAGPRLLHAAAAGQIRCGCCWSASRSSPLASSSWSSCGDPRAGR